MDAMTAPPAATFTYQPEPVPAMLARTVAKYGARPAIDFLGRRWSWAEVGAQSDRAAAGLQRIGVGPGVNVGLCLPNTPYSVILFYAILKAGGTVVNFNPLYLSHEIEKLVAVADVRIIAGIDLKMLRDKLDPLVAKGVLSQLILCSLPAALPKLPALLFRLFKRKEMAKAPAGVAYIRFEALCAGAGAPSPVTIDPERAVAALQFTGGTTGRPKAAMLTHANISVNVAQTLALGLPLREGEERVLGVLPLFHVYAMTAVMNLGVALAAELVLLPRPDVKLIMKTIRRCRPTMLPGVPTLYTAISNAAEEQKDKDLSFIKYCAAGGAPTPAEVADRFERITNCKLLEGYGLSEASPVVSSNAPGAVRAGSVGRALPGTIVQIRDPEHPERLLPAGTRGEVCVIGPQVMLGYYNQTEETRAAFVDSALRIGNVSMRALRTGDIGVLDEDGYLFIVDRIKDLIICGGYNVYPRTIEEAAYQHLDVRDAVAIGVPDAYRGQAPKLFVTLRPGASTTEAEIKRFLAAHLNKIELPREVEIRDNLPKTLVGKLSKKELVAEEAAKPAAHN